MMGQRHSARVEKLNFIHAAPNPGRVQLIRDWHLDQYNSPQLPVALLSLGITDCGKVHTAGLAIEPEHALIMLGELEMVTLALRCYIEAGGQGFEESATVERLVRRA